MRNAIKEDVSRLVCRIERLVAAQSDGAAIMRQVAVFCLSARYMSYSGLYQLLEKYLSGIELSFAANAELSGVGDSNAA